MRLVYRGPRISLRLTDIVSGSHPTRRWREADFNHIVDRIARETELVIDELMPHSRAGHYRPTPVLPEPVEREFPILNEVSGYIRFIDTRRLVLTLSSQTKATLFGIMSGRCWASSGHRIAHLGAYDLQARGYSTSGLKLGRACDHAGIACPVP